MKMSQREKNDQLRKSVILDALEAENRRMLAKAQAAKPAGRMRPTTPPAPRREEGSTRANALYSQARQEELLLQRSAGRLSEKAKAMMRSSITAKKRQADRLRGLPVNGEGPEPQYERMTFGANMYTTKARA